MTFDELEPVLASAAMKVEARLTAQFEAGRRENDRHVLSRNFGFTGPGGALSPDGSAWPAAPIKFLSQAAHFTGIVRTYLPYFDDAGDCFEIGVGVGYLMRALLDVTGVRCTGCDVSIAKNVVFREMRSELGLADLVTEQGIYRLEPFTLAAATRSVIAFLPTFDRGWSADDYVWFHESCRAQGARRVYWRLNDHLLGKRTEARASEVLEYLASVGEFPVDTDSRRFCIVSL